ncbi:MAG: ribonuclease Z [Bacteroidales bacterium]|nr:ribonuclease Z [Bacteroidales bacterium]
MELTILGCNAAVPTATRYPSSQVLSVGGHLFLIDCGEGTQFQLRRLHVNIMRIEAVFISHNHGDHVFGLIGLLSTMSLFSRSSPLSIFAPPELETIMGPLIETYCDNLTYKIYFHKLRFDKPDVLQGIRCAYVKSIPLKHRVDTCGFYFRELPKEPNIKKAAIYKYGLTIADIVSVKSGRKIFDINGDEIPRDELVKDAPQPKSYAYISDTSYLPSIAQEIMGVSLLYHESTFLSDLQDLAVKTLHSTARQAAMVAKEARACKLLLGHFSSRYDSTDCFEDEAKAVFPDTTAVYEGFKIVF